MSNGPGSGRPRHRATTARAEGATALYLTVYVDNLRAQRFYARYGFVEVGKYRFKVGEQYDDDRIWVLRL